MSNSCYNPFIYGLLNVSNSCTIPFSVVVVVVVVVVVDVVVVEEKIMNISIILLFSNDNKFY